MAKLTITLTALLFALFAVASATRHTTYTTTITTTIIDNQEGGSVDECRQQIQPLRQLPQCLAYLSPKPFSITPQETLLNNCCQQLRSIEPMCQCRGIKESLRQLQTIGGQFIPQQKMQQILEDAQRLPQQCNLDLPQTCQIGGQSF